MSQVPIQDRWDGLISLHRFLFRKYVMRAVLAVWVWCMMGLSINQWACLIRLPIPSQRWGRANILWTLSLIYCNTNPPSSPVRTTSTTDQRSYSADLCYWFIGDVRVMVTTAGQRRRSFILRGQQSSWRWCCSSGPLFRLGYYIKLVEHTHIRRRGIRSRTVWLWVSDSDLQN